MNLGDVLIVIGLVLVALDWILIRTWSGRSGTTGTHAYVGLMHIGILLIGIGILCGPKILIHA